MSNYYASNSNYPPSQRQQTYPPRTRTGILSQPQKTYNTQGFNSRPPQRQQTLPFQHPTNFTYSNNYYNIPNALPPPLVKQGNIGYNGNAQYNKFNNHQVYEVSDIDEKAERRRPIRNVELTNGNLVLDCPVPDKILRNVRYTTGEEFTCMRYTAATCNPDDFIRNGYLLRPHIYGRNTELMIVMTMYNEDDHLFIKTMTSVVKNVAHFCTRNRSKVWGKDGWQKIVVVIVADGRNKINKRVLKVLGAMGVYQDGIMQDNVAGNDVTCHLFEYTSQLMVDSNFDIRGADKLIPPIQILFCLKEKNAKKINSHRWFFNAFSAQLNPNICVLLDVGTKPYNTSIYHLWKAFDREPNIGGACGEIKAELGTLCKNLINPLVASQNFEYKMSNILDKPLESVFGYISVLPGAFSAYRYKALKNTAPGKGPLASYFKGENFHGSENVGIFEANMYLAEDRILCFELVTKKHEAWKLKYVKSAKAETDVPDRIPEFILQRRRWLNGSFFAAFYSVTHFMRVWTSGQSFFRKILLSIEFIYNAIQLFFNWFALGNFYLSFFYLTSSVVDSNTDPFLGYGKSIFDVIKSMYVMVIVTIFVSSMGNRPHGSKLLYTACISLFAVIMIMMLYCAGYTVYLSIKEVGKVKALIDIENIFKTAKFRDIVLSVVSTFGLYLFTSIIHGEPWHMFTCLIQYILLVPFYVNILMVYAFCNTHDVSWGTKGDSGVGGGGNVAQAVSGKDGKKLLQVHVPTEKQDINDIYDNLVSELRIKEYEAKQHRDAATKKDDFYKSFRTNLVLIWMFSNGILIVFFTSNTWNNYIRNEYGDSSFNPYLTFLFLSVVALSAFRSIGSVCYLILRLLFG